MHLITNGNSGRMSMSEIRDALHSVADKYNDELLHYLAEMTRRRKPIRARSPKKWPKLSPEQGNLVRKRYDAGEDMMSLARDFNTNQGRISEVINGFRN